MLLYSNKIKEISVFDLGFQKWFLYRKIKTNIFIRNIFNDEYRYNPIGVSYTLTLYLELVLYPF